MDYEFLGEIEFLIGMLAVAIALCIWGIMARVRKSSPKKTTGGKS